MSLSAAITMSVKKVNLESANLLKLVDSRLSPKDATKEKNPLWKQSLMTMTSHPPIELCRIERCRQSVYLTATIRFVRVWLVIRPVALHYPTPVEFDKKQQVALDANENTADGPRSADNEFKPSQPWSLDKWKDVDEYAGERNGKNETDTVTVTPFKLVEKIICRLANP